MATSSKRIHVTYAAEPEKMTRKKLEKNRRNNHEKTLHERKRKQFTIIGACFVVLGFVLSLLANGTHGMEYKIHSFFKGKVHTGLWQVCSTYQGFTFFDNQTMYAARAFYIMMFFATIVGLLLFFVVYRKPHNPLISFANFCIHGLSLFLLIVADISHACAYESGGRPNWSLIAPCVAVLPYGVGVGLAFWIFWRYSG